MEMKMKHLNINISLYSKLINTLLEILDVDFYQIDFTSLINRSERNRQGLQEIEAGYAIASRSNIETLFTAEDYNKMVRCEPQSLLEDLYQSTPLLPLKGEPEALHKLFLYYVLGDESLVSSIDSNGSKMFAEQDSSENSQMIPHPGTPVKYKATGADALINEVSNTKKLNKTQVKGINNDLIQSSSHKINGDGISSILNLAYKTDFSIQSLQDFSKKLPRSYDFITLKELYQISKLFFWDKRINLYINQLKNEQTKVQKALQAKFYRNLYETSTDLMNKTYITIQNYLNGGKFKGADLINLLKLLKDNNAEAIGLVSSGKSPNMNLNNGNPLQVLTVNQNTTNVSLEQVDKKVEVTMNPVQKQLEEDLENKDNIQQVLNVLQMAGAFSGQDNNIIEVSEEDDKEYSELLDKFCDEDGNYQAEATSEALKYDD